MTVRPRILGLPRYVPGPPCAEDSTGRLASNESALGPSPRAVRAWHAASDLGRYPDGSASELRGALAEYHRLPAERLVCGHGAEEVLSLLLRAHLGPGDALLVPRHAFAWYALVAQGLGATVQVAPDRHWTVDVDALLARVTPQTRVVALANPNNPTGTAGVRFAA